MHADLLSAEEGIVLGGVHLVEGVVRDVRALGDLGDRETGKALLGDDRSGCVDDSLALVLNDELARQVVAPARQATLGASRPLGWRPPPPPALRPLPRPRSVLARPPAAT